MSSDLASTISPPFGRVGQAFYFHPDTLARGKELGLDGFRFYGLGRGGVLGNVEPAIIQAAFGYFEQELISRIWNTAREVLEPRKAGAEYMECARRYGRSTFADVDGLDSFCGAAETLIENIDPAGLALFAGTAAEPLCDDTAGRAMQLAVSLREYRGCVHMVALVAEGLSMERAHAIKRPDEYSLFGYTGDPAPATDGEVASHAAAEARTNVIHDAALGCLSDSQAAALVDGITAMDNAVGS